jgi:hypothetical protein
MNEFKVPSYSEHLNEANKNLSIAKGKVEIIMRGDLLSLGYVKDGYETSLELAVLKGSPKKKVNKAIEVIEKELDVEMSSTIDVERQHNGGIIDVDLYFFL